VGSPAPVLWLLAEQRTLPFVACKGQLGIWNPSEELVDKIAADWRKGLGAAYLRPRGDPCSKPAGCPDSSSLGSLCAETSVTETRYIGWKPVGNAAKPVESSGKCGEPSFETIEKVAARLDVAVAQLFTFGEGRRRK